MISQDNAYTITLSDYKYLIPMKVAEELKVSLLSLGICFLCHKTNTQGKENHGEKVRPVYVCIEKINLKML